MCFCMTEEQKQEIEHLNMSVVEFKRAFLKAVESLKMVWENLVSIFRKAVGVSVGDFQKLRHEPTPQERYKMVKRLNRCGFNEKEVNLLIFRVYRCRNSC